jgi:antitoxin MazE
MLTKIVPIGNSRGIRIPKAMLEHSGFGDEAELAAKNGALILRPVNPPRAGWTQAFARMAVSKDNSLAKRDGFVGTSFDKSEWEW